MPKCKHCQKEISKFDVDVCPYCGQAHPLDSAYKTMDVTGYIDAQGGSEKALYRSKAKKTAALLAIFLGMFGAHDFYLAFYKKAIIELASSLLLVAAMGLLLHFLVAFSYPIAFLVPAFALFLFYAAYGLIFLGKSDLKDGRGEFLR